MNHRQKILQHCRWRAHQRFHITKSRATLQKELRALIPGGTDLGVAKGNKIKYLVEYMGRLMNIIYCPKTKLVLTCY